MDKLPAISLQSSVKTAVAAMAAKCVSVANFANIAVANRQFFVTKHLTVPSVFWQSWQFCWWRAAAAKIAKYILTPTPLHFIERGENVQNAEQAAQAAQFFCADCAHWLGSGVKERVTPTPALPRKQWREQCGHPHKQYIRDWKRMGYHLEEHLVTLWRGWR